MLFPTLHVDEAQRNTVFEIVTLIGTMKSYPIYPPSCSCDWSYYFNSASISDRIVLINRASTQINLVTLKMEAVPSSETLIHLTATQCRNPEEGHNLIDNRCEDPKNYKTVQAGLIKYLFIEFKK